MNLLSLQMPHYGWMLTGERLRFVYRFDRYGVESYIPELHRDGVTIRPLTKSEIEDIATGFNALAHVRDVNR